MKIYRILFLGAAMALPQFAPAEPEVSNQTLGQVEGVVNFCSQADAKAAPRYKEKAKALIGDLSAEDLAKARKSEEYKTAYEWISGELRKSSKDESSKLCTDFLEEK